MAHPKARTTTRIGRKTGIDPRDEGTTQLRARKRRIGRGREDLELTPTALLHAAGQLDRYQYDLLDRVGDMLRRSRATVPSGSVAALWDALLAASSRTAYRGASPAAMDIAVANIRRIGWVLGKLNGSRALVIELAEGRCPPIVTRAHRGELTVADSVLLETLRRDLDAVSVGPRKSVYQG